MKNLSFQSGSLRLDATIFYPPNKKGKHPAVLFVHGWTSARERSFQYTKELNNLGYVCMLFDMRGHGTSQGNINTFTNKEFLDDVLTAYDYLSKIKEVDPNNISAVGSSFGGYLASLLSVKRKIKNLGLRVPADYPNEAFDRLKKLSVVDNPGVLDWRLKPKQPGETYALEALHKFEGNILVIESEKDDIVPHQIILNYLSAVKDKNKLTHVLMKDAPHSLREGKFRDQVEQILTAWFKDKL